MTRQPLSLDQPVGDHDDTYFGEFLQDHREDDPLLEMSQSLLKSRIAEVLGELDYREREILRLRFGLADGYAYTLEEVGKIFSVTRERVRQIENKAVRTLQHPTRAKKLAAFVERPIAVPLTCLDDSAASPAGRRLHGAVTLPNPSAPPEIGRQAGDARTEQGEAGWFGDPPRQQRRSWKAGCSKSAPLTVASPLKSPSIQLTPVWLKCSRTMERSLALTVPFSSASPCTMSLWEQCRSCHRDVGPDESGNNRQDRRNSRHN